MCIRDRAIYSASTQVGSLGSSSSDFVITSSVSDKDILFKGNDGGSLITALTLDMSASGAATFSGPITANAGINIDNISIDGTTASLSGSSDFTIDVGGRIDLSADDNGEIRLYDGSSLYAQFKDDDDRLRIQTLIQDKDMLFVGNDGGSEVTALYFDMSDGGTAYFNNNVRVGPSSTGNILIGRNGGESSITAGMDGASPTALILKNQNSSGATREVLKLNSSGNVFFNDVDAGNYVASFTGQMYANAINVGPYATFGTDYSGWGSCLGWNVRPKIGTQSTGFEAATGYYAAGAGMIRLAGNTIGMTTWTASEIAQSNIGSGTTMFSMASNGVMSGDFNDTSDVALKENISTIANGLDIIGQLKPITFDWKNTSKGNGRGGFIAQEVETVLPNDVDGENYTGTPEDKSNLILMGKSINTSSIVAHLVKAVQELKAENDSLKGRIET